VFGDGSFVLFNQEEIDYNTIKKELSIKLVGNLVVWVILLIIGPPQITNNKTLG
jgi:hypothetical protein